MAFSSRHILLHYTVTTPNSAAGDPSLSSAAGKFSSSSPTLDSNVIIIIAFLTGLLCALGLNVISQCILHLIDHPSPSIPIILPGTAARRRAIIELPVEFYLPDLKLVGPCWDCAICLTEIQSGKRIRLLPECRHGFHARCIDRWLLTRCACPSCRQCLFAMSVKMSDHEEPGEVDRNGIEPLEPEGLEIEYRL